MTEVDLTGVAYSSWPVVRARPFRIEMSFSLLSPVVWVICSLLEALQCLQTGSYHSGLTVIYQRQTESLTACIRACHHIHTVHRGGSSLTERDFDLSQLVLISYDSELT
jgi:hypothetical protein